uniref:BSD domain-containing protein n=1 Tax=Chromera velia CCMP2878 TaxID=1169474 RepID=A0A0G4HH20_9ALVE|eukprot:Cvel_6822.t1-p1 / transcript=Cvel_6822.t1 / gene=Cvel_6822 / organism=Chromera_velia_CCMP2878 / gene_product=hypothetical protein / transcript_product=hypothetical protein / location=Cvel_scaffold344:9610-12251(+) / protein_length=683 / sequence_SO=supercontig / SO=protein_coding / is_pseudo=false
MRTGGAQSAVVGYDCPNVQLNPPKKNQGRKRPQDFKELKECRLMLSSEKGVALTKGHELVINPPITRDRLLKVQKALIHADAVLKVTYKDVNTDAEREFLVFFPNPETMLSAYEALDRVTKGEDPRPPPPPPPPPPPEDEDSPVVKEAKERLLVARPDLKNLFTSLVPSVVTQKEFWKPFALEVAESLAQVKGSFFPLPPPQQIRRKPGSEKVDIQLEESQLETFMSEDPRIREINRQQCQRRNVKKSEFWVNFLQSRYYKQITGKPKDASWSKSDPDFEDLWPRVTPDIITEPYLTPDVAAQSGSPHVTSSLPPSGRNRLLEIEQHVNPLVNLMAEDHLRRPGYGTGEGLSAFVGENAPLSMERMSKSPAQFVAEAKEASSSLPPGLVSCCPLKADHLIGWEHARKGSSAQLLFQRLNIHSARLLAGMQRGEVPSFSSSASASLCQERGGERERVEAVKEAVRMEDLEGESGRWGGDNADARRKKKRAALKKAELKLKPGQLFTSALDPEVQHGAAACESVSDPALFNNFVSSLEEWAPTSLRERPKRSRNASLDPYLHLDKRYKEDKTKEEAAEREREAKAALGTEETERRLIQRIGEFEKELRGLLRFLWTSTGQERDKREKLVAELEKKQAEVKTLREMQWGTSKAVDSFIVVEKWIERVNWATNLAIKKANAALNKQD